MNREDAIRAIAIHYGVADSPIDHAGFYKKKIKYRDEKTASAGLSATTGHINDFGGGTIYFDDLCKELNIDYTPNERQTVVSTKRKYESLKDYAESHSLTVEQCESHGINWIERNGKPQLEIQTKTTPRYKLMDGSGAWYTESGYVNHWYRGSEAVQIANDNNLDYIVIVNAEVSTVACQVRGIPATTTTTGESGINALMPQLRKHWSKKIYICLDCDETGRKASEAIHANDKNTIIIDLMLSNHGDVADFCLLHGDDSKDALERLFKSQEKVIELTGHETDINVSDRVLDALEDEITGKTPVKERAYPFAISSFRKFGGYMRNSKSGKVDIFIGGSGTGKTQLLETMDDKRNHQLGISGNFFTDEWSSKELMMRRINRYSSPHLTYDQIEDHLMFMGYQQEGVKDEDNFGIQFTPEQLAVFIKYKTFIQSWKGKTEYFGGEDSLDDTILAMQEAIERRRREGISVLYTIFDYAQLLRAKGWDNSSNRVEYAFECVKRMSSQFNVHVDMASQITKDSSKSSKDGKGIKAEDAQFLRSDKANGAFTIDRQYVKDGEDDYIETPCFWLTSRKASLGGAIEGFKHPRVPMTMIPTRLYFETRMDAKYNWTLQREWSHIKGNKFYTGDSAPYVNNNQSKLDAIPI